MSSLNNIKHVVVLMLENRSFDNLLGKLYPKTAAFDANSQGPGDESRTKWPSRTRPAGSVRLEGEGF